MIGHSFVYFALLSSCAYCLQNSCKNYSVDTTNSNDGDTKSCSHNRITIYQVNDTFENPSCGSEACLRKCCPLDSAVFNKTCVPYDGNFTDDMGLLTNSKSIFHVVHGILQCEGRTFLDSSFDEFTILDNGRLKFSHVELPITNYCVDYIETPTLSSLVCFPNEEVNYYTGK